MRMGSKKSVLRELSACNRSGIRTLKDKKYRLPLIKGGRERSILNVRNHIKVLEFLTLLIVD
jgi:hypothetical protein